MSSIYVVTDGCYSDYHICGVFTNKERAQAFVDSRCKSGTIEQYGLDDWLTEREQGLEFYMVHMTLTGDNASVKVESAPDNQYPEGYIGRPLIESIPDWFAMTIWAKDEAHALKIANDRRTQMIASST